MGRVLAGALVLAMLTLAGCTQESKPSAERQEQKQEPSEQTREQASSTRAPASETGRVGDTVQAGPFLVNPVSDPGDNYHQGVVVGDDTPDCARPEDVLESGLCAP